MDSAPQASSRFSGRFRQQTNPAPTSLFSILIAAAVNTSIIIILAISFATLVFSGPLAVHLSNSVSFILLGAAVLALVVALTSSYPGSIAAPQSAATAVAALMAASLSSQLAAPDQRAGYVTIVAALTVSAVVVGLSMLALGWFRLGRAIRFIPYPVVGGFLAGTGWVLLVGSFGVMNQTQIHDGHLASLLAPAALLLWSPGLAFGLLLCLLARRTRNGLTVPVMLIGALVVFYIGLALTGTDVTMASQQGLVIGGMVGASLWRPLSMTDFGLIDWQLVLSHFPAMLTMAFVSTVSLLLNASGLELAVEHRIDLNRELRACGLGNLATGIVGGIVGFQALSYTVLGKQLGARGRWVGVATCLGIALVFLAGSQLISLLPRFMLGGVLAFLGLQLLGDWLVDTRTRIPRSEYVIIVLIFITTALLGYLPGVGVGLVATAGLFILDYSRLSIVKQHIDGSDYQSKVIRSDAARRVLEQQGNTLEIYQLQGFIFFGTANLLVERIEARMADAARPPLAFVVLDFRLVTKLDSSAVLSYTRLRQALHTVGAQLVITNLSPLFEYQLDLGDRANACVVHLFSELDRGVEWCENQLLQQALPQHVETEADFTGQLAASLGDEYVRPLFDYLERQEVAAGEVIARQGDPGDALFLIESGLLSVQLEIPGQATTRVRTATAGAMLGEIGVYLRARRTASIVAEQPSVVYRLSAANLAAMRRDNPALAAAFNEYMVCVLAERLTDTTAALQALLA